VYRLRLASATLRQVAADPRHLGARVGVLAVLHTWGQNLHLHPHLHCVVTFRWKDYQDESRQKKQTLPATEFLRRFLQHVLPKGFVRIRQYGLLANRHRAVQLAICRRLLGVLPPPLDPTDLDATLGSDPPVAAAEPALKCAHCRGLPGSGPSWGRDPRWGGWPRRTGSATVHELSAVRLRPASFANSRPAGSGRSPCAPRGKTSLPQLVGEGHAV